MYKICFITYYWLPTCINRFCYHCQGTFTRVQKYSIHYKIV